MSLLDKIAPPKPPDSILDRSELELYLKCPLWCRLNREHPIDDFDHDRLKFVGIAFHAVMAEAIKDTMDGAQFPEALKDLASDGPPQYQPDLNYLARNTASKFRPWRENYISHEQQYAYRLAGFGPAGQDVLLTCRPDYVAWDKDVEGLYLPDWKTGWGKGGFALQAMFYAVVVARARENIQRVVWQPLFCRWGSWGKRQEFEAEEIDQAEVAIKRAVMDYLQEEQWEPTPGCDRCRICPYTERCEAERRFSDVDKDPEKFALATRKLQNQVKARLDAMKAKAPIQVDGQWFGASPFKDKMTYTWHKGTPDFMEQDEDSEG